MGKRVQLCYTHFMKDFYKEALTQLRGASDKVNFSDALYANIPWQFVQ